MTIVITHTDFRLYWVARLQALHNMLQAGGHTLIVIEIAGRGGPYDFAAGMAPPELLTWICLFPACSMQELKPGVAAASLGRKLDLFMPDVLLCGSIAFTAGAMAVKWAARHQRPVIMFDDLQYKQIRRNWMVNFIKQVFYKQVTAVLCPSAPWVATYERWHFPVAAIFFGVDVVDNDYWHQPRASKGDYFLAVGRLIGQKNFGGLLKAYHTYRCSNPATALPLLIVGEGPKETELKQMITTLNIDGVTLLPFAGAPALKAIYSGARALIMPSTWDTWGLVVNEAMAAGLPVLVSSSCGCASTLVMEGENGFTFAPCDTHRLSELMQQMANYDAAKLQVMGKASARIISMWGLGRFTTGISNALTYAGTRSRRKPSIFSQLILRVWNGRYRPV